jgi:hypothetical protein
MEWPASSQIKRIADTNQGTAAKTFPEFHYGTENPAAAMDAALLLNATSMGGRSRSIPDIAGMGRTQASESGDLAFIALWIWNRLFLARNHWTLEFDGSRYDPIL